MKRLEKLAKAAASSLLQCDCARVISHNDADGIASAGLICTALQRADIPFHASLVSRLDPSVVDALEPPVVFCDMGSGKPDLVSRIEGEVFVFDHHTPVGDLDCFHVNPHLVGVDGAFEISASGTVYTVVREMGDNVDLAGLALVGALGDRQMMMGANRTILEEAANSGVVEVRPGLKMDDGPLESVLATALDPLLDTTGDVEKTRAFLEEVGVAGELPKLGRKELSRLSTALVLKVLMQGSFAADSVVGETIRLKREVVENAFELMWILNSCGKMEEAGRALTLCMRDRSFLADCINIDHDYRAKTLSEVRQVEERLKETENLRYAILDDMDAAGVVSGLCVRYLYADKPMVILNRSEGIVKVSARGNRLLVFCGLDLSVALKEGAKKVGGNGGGHSVASGASVPLGTEEEFMKIVDEVVARQLAGGRKG
ncbi:DHH family phosphoesterase [Methanotrichaceae archaeon M04Ac]|uniref:DHH family phosphoesterase n=1 Tax=Candidatus Methanocrinis alkalitolerans TaxID=3033395 RepID=A0ABT5XCH0_9EURY|nr:DHH family phosphoesterase [Candidatus Methanocrinis alkalitolerans]MCR3882846.1 DHH family phosphoesterase [Methanothrix sp.]MDF0592360.1 DHH family phosphoesterase [Candidatus Methanocrinis alkalitolerans]